MPGCGTSLPIYNTQETNDNKRRKQSIIVIIFLLAVIQYSSSRCSGNKCLKKGFLLHIQPIIKAISENIFFNF